MTHFAHFARIFAHLAEYRNTLMIEAQEYGWPLIRQMVRTDELGILFRYVYCLYSECLHKAWRIFICKNSVRIMRYGKMINYYKFNLMIITFMNHI